MLLWTFVFHLPTFRVMCLLSVGFLNTALRKPAAAKVKVRKSVVLGRSFLGQSIVLEQLRPIFMPKNSCYVFLKVKLMVVIFFLLYKEQVLCLLCYRQWNDLPVGVQFFFLHIQFFHAYVAENTMLWSNIVHTLPLSRALIA